MSSISTSDVISGLAFILSAFSAWKTIQFNSRQKSLIESQEKLNLRLIKREDAEAKEEKKADLGATFIKLGSSKYRLKIWNKGKSTARNVRIEFPEGNDCLMQSEIDDKFPLEAIEPHHSVELIAVVHNGTKSKHVLKLLWSDEHIEANEKCVYPTL
jgi:glycosyltransferase involved in cell wall biosynthesis